MKNLFNKLNFFNVGAVLSFFAMSYLTWNTPSTNITDINEAFRFLSWQESVHSYSILFIILSGFAILYKKISNEN